MNPLRMLSTKLVGGHANSLRRPPGYVAAFIPTALPLCVKPERGIAPRGHQHMRIAIQREALVGVQNDIAQITILCDPELTTEAFNVLSLVGLHTENLVTLQMSGLRSIGKSHGKLLKIESHAITSFKRVMQQRLECSFSCKPLDRKRSFGMHHMQIRNVKSNHETLSTATVGSAGNF
jgi:hypothetical protein